MNESNNICYPWGYIHAKNRASLGGIGVLDKLCTTEKPDFAYFVSKGRRRHMAVLQNADFFL